MYIKEGKSQKEKQLYLLFIMYSTVMTALYCLPQIKYLIPKTIPLVITFAAVTFGFLWMYIKDGYQKNLIPILFSLAFAFFLENYFVTFSGDLNSSIDAGFLILRFALPAVMAIYFIADLGKTPSKTIFWIIIAIFVFIAFRTFFEMSMHPDIARALAKGSVDDELSILRNKNIGGYSFSYAFGMLAPVLIYFTAKVNKFVVQLILLLSLIFIFVYIVASQYATLLIVTYIFCAITVFFVNRNPVVRIIMIVSIIIVSLYIGNILAFFATSISSNTVSTRLSWLADFFNTGDVNQIGSSRPEKFAAAIQHWWQKPVFGNVYKDAYGNFLYSSVAHSSFAGTLEKWGLFGLTVYIIFFQQVYVRIVETLKKRQKPTLLFTIIFVEFIVMSIANPTTSAYEISYIIFLAIPIAIYLYSPKVDNLQKTLK